MCSSAHNDVVISMTRYYYLRILKRKNRSTREIVDATIVFTINDGALTCAVAIATLAFCLAMPNNFVFLGIFLLYPSFILILCSLLSIFAIGIGIGLLTQLDFR
ncbi:hypothetical protein J3R30DRAFT_3531604 [Lentinula aciculospora]|uniref:DUF6534 domain-containing protein n=1 Tax=Lentinula aciculospora TaxID=153920 RepID=A0A9W9A0J9_9AGAR|nr:hypothetical protein J3R30DRAFT_3531604 [Lentinula aciculospora]